MIAYSTEVKSKKKFVYIQVDLTDAKKLFAGIKNYDGEKEFHLTTDTNFELYIEKRKCVPLVVQICSTKKVLNERLSEIGVYL